MAPTNSKEVSVTDKRPLRVAVDGATGYLGNHVVDALRRHNIHVRCIVHSGARLQDREFLKSIGADVVEASLEGNGEGLRAALADCDVAIHLIGSIAPKKGESLADLHGVQTANLVAAAKAAKVKKLVQITALGTARDAASEYHRTKWTAEEHIRQSGIPFVIYRPSLIIGKTVGNRDSKLVTRYMELVTTRPRVPLIGGGDNKLQPIFVADLAQAIAGCVTSDQFDNQTFEMGGPQVLSMRLFVEKLITLNGLKKPVLAIPSCAAKILAVCCEAVQSVPLVSKDQVKLSSQDNICKDNALHSVFGIVPTSVDDALKTYKKPLAMAGKSN